MPCNYPATGRKAPNGAVTYYGHLQKAAGKLPPLPTNYKDFPLPCGKCTGCKLEHSRQWAVRLIHEAQLHSKNSFLTLTMTDEYLNNPGREFAKPHRDPESPPANENGPLTTARTRKTHAREPRPESLSRRELQLFTKALNQDVRRKSGKGVKYYACGEYGDEKGRPHYHLAVFGEDFSDDRVKWKRSNGSQLWRSSRLTRLWPHGDADIGELTFESAAYIARYIMKKITGSKAENHYNRVDREGNEYAIEPEFSVMSRRPGLGKEWFDQFNEDVYPHDHVIVRGHPAKPPRYYDKLLEALKPLEYEIMKLEREFAPRNTEDNTPARLEAREIVTLAKLKQNKRSLE